MRAVFISYRRGDSAGYAGRLHESLEERLGRDVVFRDVDTIAPGQDFADAIKQRLGNCAVLLAVIGREWLDARDANGTRRLDSPSDYVRLEIAAALVRPDALVIPVLVEGATMPPAEKLPDNLQPLAHRQAVALYDEDWNAGVDRLAAAIRKSGVAAAQEPATGPPRSAGRSRSWHPAVFVLALVLLAVGWLTLGRGNRSSTEQPTRESTGRPRPSANPEHAPASAHDVAIPRLCEVVDGELVYSVISASVTPAGSNQEIRVRVRAANDSKYDANFWDATFRLVLPDGNVVPPHSGLDELAEGHSVRDAVVAFAIPANVPRAALRIAARPNPGEIPLEFSTPGRPARDEHANAGDVLARAVVRTVLNERRPLLSSGDLEITLTKVLTRRFANATRLIVSVRYSNKGRYPVAASALTLRVAVADQVVAPVSSPSTVIDSSADAAGDFVFDLPPAATSATLRASSDNSHADVVLEL